MIKFRKDADGQEILENSPHWLLFRKTLQMIAVGYVWILLQLAKMVSRFVDSPAAQIYYTLTELVDVEIGYSENCQTV